MPRKDGREVLAELKADDGLKHIPVIIMTVSRDEKDILESYRLHAELQTANSELENAQEKLHNQFDKLAERSPVERNLLQKKTQFLLNRSRC